MKNRIYKSNFLLLFIFFGILCSVQQAVAADRVDLVISTNETRKIKMAVPWFTGTNPSREQQKLAQELPDTLAKALDFHGIFSIIPSTDYGGSLQVDWKRLGSDYVILGQFTSSPETLKLEMRLLDVADNKVVMGKSFSGSPSQQNSMLFRFCDSVLEYLTGTPGIASTRIAFISQKNNIKEVFLTDILGKKVRQVTRHKNLTVSPRFVPGGTSLSYSSYHTGNQNLYITDLKQSKTTRVLSRRKGLNLAPAWSPDGKQMILTLSKNGNPDLYLLDNKGNIIEQLTSRAGINVSPKWSPDGKHIAFVSDRIGQPQIYLMDMSSRNVRRLTFEGSENAEPDWSPTEDLIVYSSLKDGIYQLFTINPFSTDYGKATQLTTDAAHHESPSWSPDGNQIIFAKRDGQKNKIYGILKNGSFQRRILAFPGSQTYPQWAR